MVDQSVFSMVDWMVLMTADMMGSVLVEPMVEMTVVEKVHSLVVWMVD